MKVILCVGEKERDEHAQYLRVIREQILSVINAVENKKLIKHITVAYEPVWAIGKSFALAPKPSDIHEMSLYIKKVAIEALGKTDGLKLQVLYGGSVNSENAEAMLRDGAIDGLLVGRQSLDPEAFATIIDYANNI
jgi:triosephosphate isomerase